MAPAASAAITIDNFTSADPPAVPPGATITVTNKDPAEHSVTSDTAGQFGSDVEANDAVTFTAPTQPG